MYAIQINHRLVRDDRGCPYKYTSRRVAERKAERIVSKMYRVTFKIVEIGMNLNHRYVPPESNHRSCYS